jgi:hypothetical protein
MMGPREYAVDADRPSSARLAKIKVLGEQIRTGTARCAVCRGRAVRVLGSHGELRTLCADHTRDYGLDQQIARQRAERARMGR